jgi:D-arabinose 1-dehydrogenase-like Zn-dependent alcohol dehydrogenase
MLKIYRSKKSGGFLMKFKRAFLAEPGRFIIREVDEVPGDNEVQIKVASCGLCNWELNHWKGYITDGGYPMPLGHESAGVVTAVGSNVTRFKPGDKVSALYGPGTACARSDGSDDGKQ